MKSPKCFLLVLSLFLLLTACETRRASHPAEQPDSAQPPTLPAAAPNVLPTADTADLTRAYNREPGPRDSLILVGSRHYRLSVRVETDSTKPIDFAPAGSVGGAFAVPSDSARRAGVVRGYAETYTFTLRDSVGRKTIFRRQLHKPDFYKAAPRDIVTVTNMPPPSYLGYSTALDALVFGCYIGIPFSDVGHQATLLLDRQGRVQGISPGGPAYSDAPDCDPRISPSGRAVLTCTEVLRASQPPLSLLKPHAQLRAARFLNDTTLLVVHEYGDYVERSTTPGSLDAAEDGPDVTAPMSDYDFVTTPAQRRLPTAQILSTSGRVLRQFRFVPDYELASDLARAWARAAGVYLFVEAGHKLVVVPKAHPEALFELPLKRLPKFRLPQRPHEQPYSVISGFTRLRFYVDTLNPRAVRMQALPPAD
ncbi:hypothetical protein [Hymenobacter negativus]|uniref:DUF4221 domain-containing protein n=1 Tax=Hymenobacter negativus TaxID=2795026 RepID=A0ABS3QP42_9BACT|nr:hypothetical protein [Hymenobacter negativus]MBO2012783.1 hypothetical protein [Hymenobacter negativus]